MTYLDRRLGISVVCGALAGCASNPWFGVDTGADESEGTAATDGASSADTGSSGEGPPTSGDTVGTGSASGTTEGAEAGETSTGVDPETTNMTGMTTDVETTQGPGSDPGESTAGEELCGNGVLDDGEECDVAADPNSGCTPECQSPKCGDGYTYEGVEQCDDGPANDDNGLCTLDCKHAACGDGHVQPGEACDDSVNNGKPELGACASDCGGTFAHVLEIRVTDPVHQGSLTKNLKEGVYGADELCKLSFMNVPGVWKAMISDGAERVASATPWTGEGQSPDWVLAPYAIYVNINQDMSKKLIGVTGKERLLGKQGELLVNAIGLAEGDAWTGLKNDWTPSEIDCDDWTSKLMENTGSVGDVVAKNGTYLFVEEETVCLAMRRLYCVQQPG